MGTQSNALASRVALAPGAMARGRLLTSWCETVNGIQATGFHPRLSMMKKAGNVNPFNL
jgi:hypothetical protein